MTANMTEVHLEYHQDEPVLSVNEYGQIVRRFSFDYVVGKIGTGPNRKIESNPSGDSR